jgi:hypothetical protein
MSTSPTSLTVQSAGQVDRPETFAPRNLKEAFEFAHMVLISGMAPKSYTEIQDPEKARAAIVVALQLGLEVGFQPMQALQSIASINQMPCIWGDGALGLIKSKGVLEYIKEDDFDVIKANKKATCIVKRRGEPNEVKITFSYQDAIDAKLFTRNVWAVYPYRMCQLRARAFALRNTFPDVLKGLAIREEVEDYEPVNVTPTPEPARPQASVTVPTAQPATTQPSTTINAQQTQPQSEQKPEGKDPEAFITLPEAKAFADAWKATGFTMEQAKESLKPYMPEGVAPNSMKIKNKDYAELMSWAKQEFDDARGPE